MRSRVVFTIIFLLLVGITFFKTTVAQVTENMAVTATVPADAGDFPVQLVQDTAGTRFSQNTELAYTITYGSELDASVDLTLTASWTRGTIDGESSPSIDIIDYVPGSASNAYNSTPPVIDTVNRTITWTISAFPGQTTNQQVTFRLTTNNSYTGTDFATFSVTAQSEGASAQSTISTVSKEYLYDASLEPTATPTPVIGVGPSATPGPGATSTPTPTPTRAPVAADLPFRFTQISLETVSTSAASILTETTEDATVVFSYGPDLNDTSQLVEDLSFLKTRLLRLSGLEENTRYYLRISAKNRTGKIIESDIYTFITGRRGATAQIDRAGTIMTSGHILLYPSEGDVFIIPKRMDYELNLAFSNPSVLRSVKLLVAHKGVLGATTARPPNAEVSSNIELKETAPGKYTARLVSPQLPGAYSLSFRVADTSGNITDQQLGTLKVTEFLTVLSKGSNRPIEHARVRILHHNYRSGKYEFISPQILPIANPVYSEPDGTVRMVLPPGRYRADVSTILDTPKQTEFTIGPGQDQEFPTVYLDREPFSLISFIRYQWETCLDAFSTLRAAFVELARSLRLFELNAYILLLLFIGITYVSLSKRIRVPLRSFIGHVGYHVKKSYYSSVSKKTIEGTVINQASGEPIVGADVFLIDPRYNTVLTHTKTRSNGAFSFPTFEAHAYVFEVMEDGFVPSRFYEDELVSGANGYRLCIERVANPNQQILSVVDRLLAASLEVFLIFSLLLEVLFVYVFGLVQTAPFIVLSLLNLILMIFHEQKRRTDQ